MSAPRKPTDESTPMGRLKALCRSAALRDELFKLSDEKKSAEWRAVIKERFGIWLSADSQVTRWRAWAAEQMREEMRNDFWERIEQKLSRKFPDKSREQIREVGLDLYMEEGVASGDPKLFLEVLDRDLAERSAQTKAQFKQRELAIQEMRLLLDTDQFASAMLKKAAELNDSALSQAERIKAMRQAAFSEVDALQKSGAVQIPN